MFFEVFLDFECGHAAGSGGGDGLAVAAVLHVAAGKDAGDAGEDVVVGADVAVFVEVELAGEHPGVGLVADAEEESADRQDGYLAGDAVAQAHAFDFLVVYAEDFFDDDVGEDLDFGVGHGAVEHDAGGAEVLAAMEDGHLGAEAGEEERFFHGGVATADDRDFPAGEEEAVAGGAGADTVADERLLGGQAEPAGGGSTGDDEGAGVDLFVAVAEVELEGMLAEIGLGEMAEAELGAEARGLLAHVLNELGALDAVWPAGEVFDERGDGELPAGLMAFEDERLQVGACGIDCGGEAGAAGAKDDGIANRICHGLLFMLPAMGFIGPALRCNREVSRGGLEGDGAIYDGGMANLTLVYGLRLLPADEVASIGDAPIELKNGNRARVTMHLLEGTREEIEGQLRQSIDAFFDFFPEI